MKRRTLILPKLRRQTFRVTLSQFGAAMVLFTGLGVALVAYVNSRATVRELSSRVFATHASYAAAQAADYASSARHTVGLTARLVQRGALPRSLEGLGPHLVDTIRTNPRLSTAGWGTPDGAATWASQGLDGTVVLHVYDGHDEGRPWHRAWQVAEDGRRTLVTDEPTTYDGTTRPWYVAGAGQDAPRWTEPYMFVPEYVPGITLSQRVTDGAGGVVGVLTVDFQLEFLSRALQGLDEHLEGTHGVIFDRAGYVLGHTAALTQEHQATEVATLASHPDPLIRRMSALWADELTGTDELLRHFTLDGQRYALEIHAPSVDGMESLDWFTAVIVPERILLRDVRLHAMWSIAVALLGLVLAVLASVWISVRLTESFYGFYEEMERVGRLELEPWPRPPTRILEIERLAARLDALKTGLQSFSRYLPVDLVRQLLAEGKEATLGGEVRTITVVFTDIRDFTTIVESSPPEELVVALGTYLEQLDEVIAATSGNVAQYLGDGLMALWGAPRPLESHAEAACHAALRMRERSNALAEAAAGSDLPGFHTRIGVNTGEVLVGNIGAPERFNYTAIGDVVNTASRIEGLNKHYRTQVLIGEDTRARIGAAFVTRRIEQVRMKGKTQPVWIHELVGTVEHVPAEVCAHLARYEQALDAYTARDFATALAAFEEVSTALSGDHASDVLAEACRRHLASPPPPGWDGARTMHRK